MNINKSINIKKGYKNEGEVYDYDIVKKTKGLWPGWYSTYDVYLIQLLPLNDDGVKIIFNDESTELIDVEYVKYILWKVKISKKYDNYKYVYSEQKIYVKDDLTLKDILNTICRVEGVIVEDKILDCDVLDEAA